MAARVLHVGEHSWKQTKTLFRIRFGTLLMIKAPLCEKSWFFWVSFVLFVDRVARPPTASVSEDEREVDGQTREGKSFKTRRKQKEHKRDVWNERRGGKDVKELLQETSGSSAAKRSESAASWSSAEQVVQWSEAAGSIPRLKDKITGPHISPGDQVGTSCGSSWTVSGS